MVSEPTLLGLKSMASANKMRRLKYSCEEVYERMDNGLCIFCDELDTPGHHDLKHKGIQIFIVDDDLACNDVEEVHKIHQAVKNPDPSVEPVKNPDALIEPLDCASVLQVLASVPDVLMVDRVDSHVKEVEESSQQSTNGNDKIVAHQLFDQMPQRKAEEEKQQTEALGSELNRMLAELKTMTANREATMSKFLSQASIPPRPPFPPPDPPDMCRFGLVKGFVKECEDASMSGDEASHETNSVSEKETIPSSALCQRVPVTLSQNNNVTQQEELNYDMETIVENGLVQEHESLGLTDSVLKVDCVHSREFSSQFQDEEEFIGLNLGKLLKNERLFSIICLLGLNDMSCWTQLLRQQIFPKSWRFKFKTASRESKLLDNNFSGNIKLIKQRSSGDNELIWTQFSSLVKASEMSVLGRDKWKWSEKHRMYNKAWKFKYIQRLMLSVLLQMEQYKLLQGRTINCKMRKKEVLRRIKQTIFIEMQFHMKNNSEFNFQANTRVLELIKDKASRKRKLCKNWWFKYKLNTWFSEALHLWRKRNYEKLQRASEHMMCELIHKIRKACQCVVHETNETASHVWYWWKTKAEIVQILLKPIMHLKGKEETFSFKDAATNCSSKTKISGHVLKQVFGRATHGLFLKQSLSQFLLHIQNRDCSFFGYMLMATSDCFGTLLGIPDKEIAKPHNIYVLKALILWKWYPPEQATWIFSELIQNSLDLRQFTRVKFYLKHKWRSKFGSSKLARTLTRQKAWPRVLPRLHVRAFNLSFLRTRMFSTGEYCYRKYYLSSPVHIYSLGLSNYSV